MFTLDTIYKLGVDNWIKNYKSNIDLEKYDQIHIKVSNIYHSSIINFKNKKDLYWYSIATLPLIDLLALSIFNSYLESTHKSKDIPYYLFNKELLSKYKFPDKPFVNRIKSKIKYLIQNFKYYFYYFFLGYKKVYHIGPIQKESKLFLSENNFFPFMVDTYLNKKKIIFKNREYDDFLKYLFINLTDEFLFLDKHNIELIRRDFSATYKNFAKYFFYFKKTIISHKKSSTYLATVSGWLPIRIIMASCLSLEKKLISFNHSFTVVYNQKPDCSYDGLLLSTDMIISSGFYKSEHLNKLKSLNQKFSFPNLLNFNSFPYSESFSSFKKISLPKKIKKILLIGYPKSYYLNHNEPYNNLFTTLDLEIRIIDYLKSKNYEIDYKIHPDRINEGERLFVDKCNIVKNKFENVYLNYDCAIFIHHRTTALAVALIANMPIVFFQNKQIKLDKFTKKIYSNRFSIVSTELVKNRITYDNLTLIDKIKQSLFKANNRDWESFIN